MFSTSKEFIGRKLKGPTVLSDKNSEIGLVPPYLYRREYWIGFPKRIVWVVAAIRVDLDYATASASRNGRPG